MNRMRATLAATLPALLPLTASMPAPAREGVATPAAAAAIAEVLPPAAAAYGATYPEWAARYAQWLYSFPLDDHPLNRSDGRGCAAGQHGEVFFLGSVLLPGDEMTLERACTVPADRALLLNVVFLGCSTLEADYCGTTEEELRATAARWVDKTTDVAVELDGVAVPDMARFRVAAGPFGVVVPEASPGVEAGVGMGVVDGYFVLFAPLAAGEHTLHVVYANSDMPAPHDVTYRLTVAPAAYAAASG